MQYKDVIHHILKNNDKINFATIYDMTENMSKIGHHNGAKNPLLFNESVLLFKIATKSWESCDIVSTKLGSEKYILTVHERLKQLIVRFGKEHLIYIEIDVDSDHEKIINTMLRLEENISKK